MPEVVKTEQPTITLRFTLDEASAIMANAIQTAEPADNWYVVNMLSDLRDFVNKNKDA